MVQYLFCFSKNVLCGEVSLDELRDDFLCSEDVDDAEVFNLGQSGQLVAEEIGEGRDTIKRDEWSLQEGCFQVGCSTGRENEVAGSHGFIVVI